MDQNVTHLFPLLFLIIIPIAILAGLLVTVLPFWYICKKAGYSGALSLLMLVPLGNIILPFFLAFSDWPALQQHNDRTLPPLN